MAAKHILVVTADPDVARVLATALELAGIDVGMAGSSAVALTHFREQPTQLVIIDLGSLAGAGEMLCGSIRSLTDGAVVPLVFLGTGREQVATLADALAAGADYFFKRPVEAVRVVSRVLTYLGGGSAEAVPGDLIVAGGGTEAAAAATPEVTLPAASIEPAERPRESSLSAIDAAIDDALSDALASVPERVRPATDREPTVVGPAPTDEVAAIDAEAEAVDAGAEPSAETSSLISRLKKLQQATHSTQRHPTGPALEALVDELIAADQVSVAVANESETAAPSPWSTEPASSAAPAPEAAAPPAITDSPATSAAAALFPEVTLPDLSAVEQVAAADSPAVAGPDPFARQQQEAEALKLEIDRLAQREAEARASVAEAQRMANAKAKEIEDEAQLRAEAKAQEIEAAAQLRAEARAQELEAAARQQAEAKVRALEAETELWATAKAQDIETEARRQAEVRAKEIETEAQLRAEARAQEIEADARRQAEAKAQEIETSGREQAEALVQKLVEEAQRKAEARARELEDAAQRQVEERALQLEASAKQRAEATAQQLEIEVRQRTADRDAIAAELQQRSELLAQLDERVQQRQAELATLETQADQSADEIGALDSQLSEQRRALAAAAADLQQRSEELALLETAARERAAELAAADVALQERRSELDRLQTVIEQQRGELAMLEADSRQRAAEVRRLDEQGRALADAENRKLAESMQQREAELQQLQAACDQAVQGAQAAALEQAQRSEELAALERAVAAQRAEFEQLEQVARQSALERQQRAEQEQQQAAAELQRLDDELQRRGDALREAEERLAQRETRLRQQEEAQRLVSEQLQQAEQTIAQHQTEASRRREAGAERLRQGANARQQREERARQWFSASGPPAPTRRQEPLAPLRDDRPSLSAVAPASASWLGTSADIAAPEPPPLAPLEFVPLQPEEGTLDDAQLPALLAEIYFQRVTGRVDFVLEAGRAVRSFYFEAGEPVHVRSNLRHDQFAEFLLRRGLLTREQHALARAKQVDSARQLGAALLEEGVLKTRELFDAVREHLADSFLALLEWPQASFRYLREHVPEVDRVVLAISAGALVAEGVRRKYDVDRLLRAVGGPATLLAPTDLDRLTPMQLRPDEQRAADLLDGVRTLEDLILAAGIEDAVAYRTALIAIACGAHEVAARGVDIVDADRALAAEHEQAIDRARLAERLRLAREANYFDFLGLPRTATGYEIEAAVGQLLDELDRVRLRCADENAISESVAEIGRVAQDAYSVLRNDHQRERYRRNLRA